MAESSDHVQTASDVLRQSRTALGGMEHGLTTVMQRRERDFLVLGEDLMALQAGCADIARDTHELVERTAGRDLHATLGRLAGELTGLTDEAINDAGRRSLAGIRDVGGIVEKLSGIVGAFSKIVKHLTMLGIATRIESARLGADGRGFSTLADDVEKLAHLIVDHCAAIASKVETLRGHVHEAKERTLATIRAQQQCHGLVSGELAANIEGLAAMADRSAAVSRNLSGTAGEIETAIGQAVRSLQSHDIVRQQIEHAEHALAEVVGLLAAGPRDDDNGEDALDLVAFVADVLTLQLSQLESADRHFSGAADVLRESLASLAARIRGIGAEIAAVAGASGGESPLGRVQAGITAIKTQLGDFASQGEALGGIMAAVAATIAGMGGSIEAIEEVGAEIELIALNASIKAAHTGEAGAALGVLALGIQHLSADARRQTDAVAAILGDIAKASQTLQDTAGEHNDQSETWRVVGALDAALADVAATSEACRSLFVHLDEESGSHGARAETVGRAIAFDRDIGGHLAALRRTLEEQVALARSVVPEGGRGRSVRLRELYDRYTMEAERAVHETAFGLTPAAADATAAMPASREQPANEDGFGDNVELF